MNLFDHRKACVIGIAIIIAYIVMSPGLAGPWLFDDDVNLGTFRQFSGGSAPYANLIFGNSSGPLGRPVSMASFALNHYMGLFDTVSLKAGNLLLHLLNGLLLLTLLSRLQRARPMITTHAWLLPGLVAAWWLVLPLHVSTVLYIVQRMTLLAGFFSLAACLTYVHGRMQPDTRRGIVWLALSLLVCLPLAVLAKESAFVTLPWLVLIELFFFRQSPFWRFSLPQVLAGLVALTIIALVALTLALNISSDYLIREFSLEQRLLTQGRVIWSYIRDIFLPSGASMGLFHDDYPLSLHLLAPFSTLPALVGIVILVGLAIRSAATRWWPAAFGIMFYFAGHLVESTIVPLEIYFEHRNYLPSLGLLLAVVVTGWLAWPHRRKLALMLLLAYLLLLSAATLQRSHIWASKSMLLETSARYHPHSLRAWTDYPEDLLENRHPRQALEAALLATKNNPAYAGISYMQMISIYCRIREPVPAPLIAQTALALQNTTIMASTVTTPLGIGLELILAEHKKGKCGNSAFAPLIPALVSIDSRLVDHYTTRRNSLWFLRLTLAEWLQTLGKADQALPILDDIWRQGDYQAIPMVGLALADTLVATGRHERARQVLAELTAVTHDAPDDFKTRLQQLQQASTGHR